MDRETLMCQHSIPRRAYRRSGHTVIQAALVGLVTVLCLGAVVMAKVFHQSCAQETGLVEQNPAKEIFDKYNLFRGWERPELVILLSGEMHGYLQPCGCSPVQYGGLTRRYNLLQGIKAQGWPVVAVDLGDLIAPGASQTVVQNRPQAMLKYKYAMKALDAMQYSGVTVGEYEMKWYLPEVIAEYALNNPRPPILAANIIPGQDFQGSIQKWEATPKVGVLGLIGPSVEKKVPDLTPKLPQFDPKTPAILTKALMDMKAKGAEVNVLLYQGKKAEAINAANAELPKGTPRLDVILHLSDDPEPPGLALMVGKTMLINVGHKGRYVGVVGVFRNPEGSKTPFDFRYQLVSIGPEFDTPDAAIAGHKVMDLLQEYAREVKDGNYLAKFKQTEHPTQLANKEASYVGSDSCMNCHANAFKIWKGSKHAHAYKALVDAKNPSLRQFDGECIVCHTVGFNYKTGFRNLEATKFLTDVGCESCHGPCSEHVAKPRDLAMHKLINPNKYRGAGPEAAAAQQVRMQRLDTDCQKCHDLDNDVNWNFTNRWKQVVHMNK